MIIANPLTLPPSTSPRVRAVWGPDGAPHKERLRVLPPRVPRPLGFTPAEDSRCSHSPPETPKSPPWAKTLVPGEIP